MSNNNYNENNNNNNQNNNINSELGKSERGETVSVQLTGKLVSVERKTLMSDHDKILVRLSSRVCSQHFPWLIWSRLIREWSYKWELYALYSEYLISFKPTTHSTLCCIS